MRRILSTIFLIFVFIARSSASNYYFSTSTGDDSRTVLEAQNKNTPWQSINKLDSIAGLLLPGDSVLFKCGDTFFGNIIVNVSGSIGNPIVFSCYGSGPKPLITSMVTLSNWTSVGNGIYESHNDSLNNGVNMVVANNYVQPMGRFPNKGYLTFQSHQDTTSITDNTIQSGVDWTGAEIVVRTRHWILDRAKIISNNAGNFTFSPALTYEAWNNYGYFIQNDIRTLDTLGEWYYNSPLKNIDYFFGSQNPSDFMVNVATRNNLISLVKQNNIVFDHLIFMGSLQSTLNLVLADNVEIKYCDILNSGCDGVFGSKVTNMQFHNNTITNSANSAINFDYACNNNVFKWNTIKNTSKNAGLIKRGEVRSDGLTISGSGNLIVNNFVDSSGSGAISFTGDSNVIKNNYLKNFNFVKDDQGGIYTWNSTVYGSTGVGRKIIGNIVINGIGASEGADARFASDGIYTDDNSSGVEVIGNTVSKCNNNGIFVHNSFGISVMGNTSYDNGSSQVNFTHDSLHPTSTVRNIISLNNIFFSKTAAQITAKFQSIGNDLNLMGSLDSNYYCRPMAENFNIQSRDYTNVTVLNSLASWKKFGYDSSSKVTPAKIPSYKIGYIAPTNKFSNGTFTNDLSGMYVYSNATSYSAKWVNSNILDGGSLLVNTNSVNPCVASTVISIGSIDTTKQYVVKFTAYSDSVRNFRIYLMQSTSPYHTVSKIFNMSLNPGRQDMQFVFTNPSTTANATLVIESRNKILSFGLDNVVVSECQVYPVYPDEYLRFEYNPSASNRTISLSKTYIDVKNNIYRNSVVLQPYASVILIDSAISNLATSPLANIIYTRLGSTVEPMITLQKFEVTMGPNPTSNNLTIFTKGLDHTKHAIAIISNTEGQIMRKIAIYKDGVMNIDIGDFSKGIYTINIFYEATQVTRKIVKL